MERATDGFATNALDDGPVPAIPIKAGEGLGLFRRMLRRQVFSVALVCNLFLDLSLSRSLSVSLNLSIFLCLARHVLFWPVCALLHRHENCRAWVPLPRFGGSCVYEEQA